MTLVIDENLPPGWQGYLAGFGIVATHWREIGKAGESDKVIFAYACEHGATILTQDLDFTRMLALWNSKLPSVIQLRVPCPIPEIAGPAILAVLENHRQQLQEGCLISVDLKRYRVRLLPLH